MVVGLGGEGGGGDGIVVVVAVGDVVVVAVGNVVVVNIVIVSLPIDGQADWRNISCVQHYI